MSPRTKSTASKPSKASPPTDPLFAASDKLKEVERLRLSGKLQQSKRLCEELVREFPDYVGALHTLGLVLADMREYEQSISYLSKAAMLCPRDWKIHTALSGANLRLKRTDTAISSLEQAQKLKPGDPTILGTLGQIYRRNKEYELAANSFEEYEKLDSSLPSSRLSLASCYEYLGRLDEAASLYVALIQEGHGSLDVVSRLAQLPESLTALTGLDIFSLLENLPAPADTKSDWHRYTRAVGLHRAGRYAEAWEQLVAANETVKPTMAEEWRSTAAARQYALDLARRVPRFKNATERPRRGPISLFILGPSRSGKTTLERLLGALPGVKRGYENPIIENTVRRTMQTSGCITRASINGMPPGLDPVFLDIYTEELKERAGDSMVFTNTHPAKIVEVVRYAKAIPGARFLFVKRDPYDLILRTFMKNYSSGNSYAYDVNTIKENMDWYYALIDICVEKLPDISQAIDYEDVIGDPSSALLTAGEICGIDVELESLPELGDDRGIAAPYRDLIQESLGC